MRYLGLHTKFDGYLRLFARIQVNHQDSRKVPLKDGIPITRQNFNSQNSNLNLNSNYCEKKFPSAKILSFQTKVKFLTLKNFYFRKTKITKHFRKKKFFIYLFP